MSIAYRLVTSIGKNIGSGFEVGSLMVLEKSFLRTRLFIPALRAVLISGRVTLFKSTKSVPRKLLLDKGALLSLKIFMHEASVV